MDRAAGVRAAAREGHDMACNTRRTTGLPSPHTPHVLPQERKGSGRVARPARERFAPNFPLPRVVALAARVPRTGARAVSLTQLASVVGARLYSWAEPVAFYGFVPAVILLGAYRSGFSSVADLKVALQIPLT